MLKIVGLTGGIGSGKTGVSQLFTSLGVPCYLSDIQAKRLMVESQSLRSSVIDLFGKAAYQEGKLNRDYLASLVFSDPTKLAALNQLVHPVVNEDFRKWVYQQSGRYCIKESAILFENGAQASLDKSILVVAPKEVRIERVMKRDQCSRAAVVARMNNQWEDVKKIPLADFVVNNVDWEDTREQIIEIHRKLDTI